MSQPCDIAECKRVSRALCHCCHQNLCRDHLNEHDKMLNDQLNPYIDQINQLHDYLNHIDVTILAKTAHEHIDHWRNKAHQLIDRYFEEKRHELDEYLNQKMSKRFTEIKDLRTLITQLLENQDTTTEHLHTISSTIQSIQMEIKQIEYQSTDLSFKPLERDNQWIQIGETRSKVYFDLTALTPPSHTIPRSADSPKPLASNDRCLLMHYDNELALLNLDMTMNKHIPWTYGWIHDMCWSSAISQFILITINDIFLLEEHDMKLKRFETKERYCFNSCTCSETSLYVTINELGSSIFEFEFLPKLELVNRWSSKEFCHQDELIQSIVFDKGKFGFIVENQTSCTKRLELRSANGFAQLWSIPFDLPDPFHSAYSLCLFNVNEWLVVDWRSSQITHITKEGQIKSTCTYPSVPYRCCQFGTNILAVSSKNSIHFHPM